ncbi:MAG: hypothetical protein MR227_04875 [Firmicutes bacterium]|nr:hypothetical protein [Bacillota bacterium]
MYISRELILGLALESRRNSFNNEEIEMIRILISKIISSIRNGFEIYTSDLSSELESFWKDYYFIENGYYKIKDISDKSILHISAFNTFRSILELNQFSSQQIDNIVIALKCEMPKMFAEKQLIKKNENVF